jgi:SAM-dependent methyltransferase
MGTERRGVSLVQPLTVRRLDRKLYPRRPDRYRELIDAVLRGSVGNVLLFGAGRGVTEGDLRAHGREVVGIDVDTSVLSNPIVDRAVVYDGRTFPFADQEFDLCCSSWVIEHLADPRRCFREIARVLRPGGHLIFRTSNLLFYAYLVSWLVPNRFHPKLVTLATGLAEDEVFPAWYRANTRRLLRTELRGVGLQERELRVHLDGAHYLAFSLPTYLVGVLYERVVNSTPLLEDFRQMIVGDFVKGQY